MEFLESDEPFSRAFAPIAGFAKKTPPNVFKMEFRWEKDIGENVNYKIIVFNNKIS